MAPTTVRHVIAALMGVAVSLPACAGPTAFRPVSATAPPSLPSPAEIGPPANPRTSGVNSWLLRRATPATATDDMPLGPGDLILVNVFMVSELSQLSMRIPGNGTIALPLIGAVPAAGRTARDLEDDIKARLREKYMHDPQVSVFVQEHKSQQVAVFGAVKTGGVYPLVGPLRVTDALAMAGALNEEADQVVYLIRRTPRSAGAPASQPSTAPAARTEPAPGPGSGADDEEIMVPIDLEKVIEGRHELNVRLQSGDVIHVPRAGSYYVGGDVMKPGSFLVKGKTTVQQAIVNAGGVRPTADWDDVRVYRPQVNGQYEILKFSLNELEERPGSKDIEIKKNDVVVLGQSYLKAFGYGVLQFIRFGVGASVPF